MIPKLDFIILSRIFKDLIITHRRSLLREPAIPQLVVFLAFDEGFSSWSRAFVVFHQSAFGLGIGLNNDFTQLIIKVYFINENAKGFRGAEFGK